MCYKPNIAPILKECQSIHNKEKDRRGDNNARKSQKKFKIAFAFCENSMYIKKSSVMLDLSAKLKDDG